MRRLLDIVVSLLLSVTPLYSGAGGDKDGA
jgi:hypothetical protein